MVKKASIFFGTADVRVSREIPHPTRESARFRIMRLATSLRNWEDVLSS